MPAELVEPSDQQPAEATEEEASVDAVTSPAKVMRIGSMVKMLLEEVRAAPLDEPSRERLAEIYERSIVELSEALSPDLQHELKMLALPFRDGEVPTEGEIRVAKAQLVGWLEGLFHGIQATLFAQQLAARQQLEQIRQLPPGMPAGHARPAPAARRRPPRHVPVASLARRLARCACLARRLARARPWRPTLDLTVHARCGRRAEAVGTPRTSARRLAVTCESSAELRVSGGGLT